MLLAIFLSEYTATVANQPYQENCTASHIWINWIDYPIDSSVHPNVI